MPATSRNAWIDVLKGAACLAIVCHHLAAYGPLSDTAAQAAPRLSAWFYDYARMAVQIFLVLGGYLAAASLAPEGAARFARVDVQIARRFMRLVVPYAAALAVTVAVAALVKPWLNDPSVPEPPTLSQMLANALMLQDVLGIPALSAGVWYVAIDLQLFACAALLLAMARQLGAGDVRRAAWWGMAAVVVVCAASLLWFNRDPALDAWSLYFFGAYGLGMAAFWAARSAHARQWLLCLALLGLAALVVEFRPRLALALGTAVLVALLTLQADWAARIFGSRVFAPLVWVGKRSYSVFLIHFSVCLAVNAVFGVLWPGDAVMHGMGLVVALALSLAAGRWLYERVERREASPSRALQWQMRLAGASVLAIMAQGLAAA